MSDSATAKVSGGGATPRWLRALTLSAAAVAICCGSALAPVRAFAYYPTSSIAGIPGGWSATDVTFTLSSDEPEALIVYWLDGSATSDIYHDPVTISADGVTTVMYQCHDGHSLREDPHYATIYIDKVAPVSSVSGVPAGWTSPGAHTLQLSATDGESGVAATYYRVDDGAPQPYAGVPIPVIATHTTWVDYWSVDNVGNVEAPKTAVISVDEGLPITTLLGLPGTPSGWSQGPVTLTLTGESAHSSVTGTSYKVGAGPLTAYTAPFIVSAQGATPLSFLSVDAAGDREPTRTVMVDIDGSPPTSSASGLPSGPTPSNVTFSLAATDTLSGVAAIDYQLDGGGVQAYATPLTLAASANASSTHALSWWALDRAGNAETAHTALIQLDTRLPVTAITGCPDSWVSGPVTFQLSAVSLGYSVAATYYQIGSGAVHTYSGPVTVASQDATTVSYWSVDSQGQHEAPVSRTLLIDSVAPVSALSGIPGGTSVAPVTFALQASDTGSGVREIDYALDGGASVPYTGPVTVSTPGLTTLTWWALDWAGNAETPHTVSFSIASGAVSTSILGVPAGWTNGEVTVSLEADGDASGGTFCRLGSGPYVPYAGPFTVSAEGTTVVSCYSVNALGVLEPTKTAPVRIDRTPPVTACSWWPSYAATATIVLAPSDTMSGVAGTTWAVDGGAPTSGTVAQVSAPGTHTVTYGSVDEAGNAESPHTVSFFVGAGLLQPVFTIAASPKSVAYPRPFTLSGTLTRGVAGDRCVVEVRKPGSARWSYSSARLASALSSSSAAWWYRYTPKVRGTYTFRVRFEGDATRAPVLSGTVSVRVR